MNVKNGQKEFEIPLGSWHFPSYSVTLLIWELGLGPLGDTATWGHSLICVYVYGYWYAFLFIICRHFTNNGSRVCFLSSCFLNGNDNLKFFCRRRSSLVEKFHCVLWGSSLGHISLWKGWYWEGIDNSFGDFEVSSCSKWVKLIAMMVAGEVEVKWEHTGMGVDKATDKIYKEPGGRMGMWALASPCLSRDGLRVGSAA